MKNSLPPNHERTIEVLYAFLKQVIADPSSHIANVDLVAALSSQSATAKLSIASEGVFPTSLNTTKRHAEKWIPGGYSALDAARMTALDTLRNAIHLKANEKKRTKHSLEERIRELNRRARQDAEEKMLLTAAIGDAIHLLRDYAEKSKDGALIVRCNKDVNNILRQFSITIQNTTTSTNRSKD